VREILAFATNVEQAADIVAKDLLGIVGKMIKRRLSFSESGQADLMQMLDRLLANVRTAGSLFMTGDERAARLLASEKESFRSLEAAATEAHFERLRSGRIDTAETSALHLDTLRYLKDVNAHLVAGAAYPLLESKGELLASRLRYEM
jgi:phosphate:Na+ symporter